MEFLKNFFAPGSTSEQWKLDVQDFRKGITMAVLTGITTWAGEMTSKAQFVFDWTAVWHAATAAAVAYLLKNLMTPGVPKAP